MKRRRTDGIVIHRAETYSTDEYHFLIQKDGSVKTMVPVDDRGAHAVAYNGSTIAIAVFGDFASSEPGRNSLPTSAQIEACITLMRKLNFEYGGMLWASGHSQLGRPGTNVPMKLHKGHTCPGESFPLASVIHQSGCRTFPGRKPLVLVAAKS